MSVRFILGRAGGGKTHHCLESIRSRLQSNPVDGPPLIYLVPEQASFQAERAIVEPGKVGPDVPASHRAEVLSFQRLAFRLLDLVQAPRQTTLTERARAMVLRHLVAREASTLRYYRRVERAGGWIDRIAVTITELIQESVEPDALQSIAAENAATAWKLSDLRVIYQAYLDYLSPDRVDPSQYLAVARLHLPSCGWIEGAHLWVDGFASMSEQEVLTLLALARKCEQVEITVLTDPAVVDRIPATPNGRAAQRLFSRTVQTYQRLRSRFAEAGFAVDAPLVLEPRPLPRFRGRRQLAGMEARFFEPRRGTTSGTEPPRVEVARVSSRRVEVDYAVARVCEWVRKASPALRYRDVAIIVRDLEPYHDLLSNALTSRGVPFFIDRRRPLSHHPLVEWMRSLLAVASTDLSLEAARMLLKAELLPAARDAADALENYLIAYGLEGLEVWRGSDWDWPMPDVKLPRREGHDAPPDPRLQSLNRARRTVLDALAPWFDLAMSNQALCGTRWAGRLRDVLARCRVDSTLADWAREAEESGDLDDAEEHRQAWAGVADFLDDLAFAFADIELTLEELRDVVQAGLSVLTAGLVPPSVDQVLVGSIERSRHPDVKAAVVLGLNDGVFPARLSEDSILNDEDRAALRAGGITVAAPLRDRVADESLLAYIAMTRASEYLVVTFATTDESGKALRPSPYLPAVCEAAGGIEVRDVADPSCSHDTWDLTCVADLRRRLGEEFRGRLTPPDEASAAKSRWNTIYDRCRTTLAQDRTSRPALAGLAEPPDCRLGPHSAQHLFGRPLRTSVSRLEAFASCPFQHFARYALGLRPRREARLEAADVGTVHHAILQCVIDQMREDGRALKDWSDGQIDRAISLACGQVMEIGHLDATTGDARDEYVLRRSAERIARVIRFQQVASRDCKSRPAAAELAYGFEQPTGLPALRIRTPRGRTVELRGFIDRVDVAEIGDQLLGIVIDYKRARDKHLDLSEVYHGLSLQLPAYLLALAEGGRTPAGRPMRPIGALYVSLATRYERIVHPSAAVEQDALRRSGLGKPRGLLMADEMAAIDPSLAQGRSRYYNVFIKKDGKVGQKDASDGVDRDEFQATLEHTRRKLGELADAMVDGCVDVAPYRLAGKGPCDWCEMQDVCRRDQVPPRTRFFDTLKRSDALRRMVEERGP